MKHKLKTAALMLALVLLVSSGALAANVGYAPYRDKNGGLEEAGHTGIVEAVSGGTPTYIVHHPGSGTLSRVTFANFQEPNCTYYGEYYMPGFNQSTYNKIRALAYTLYDDYSISYTWNMQMGLKWPVNTIVSPKIEPVDILNMRCDGLVEYCYEYYGIRLLGSSTHWNIANPAHYTSHSLNIFSPVDQRAKLTKS